MRGHFQGLRWRKAARQRLNEQRVEEAAPGVVAASETCLQAIAQRQQIIDFGDDAALFGTGWERD